MIVDKVYDDKESLPCQESIPFLNEEDGGLLLQ